MARDWGAVLTKGTQPLIVLGLGGRALQLHSLLISATGVEQASTFDDTLQQGNVPCGVELVDCNKSTQHVRPDKVSDR